MTFIHPDYKITLLLQVNNNAATLGGNIKLTKIA